MKPNTLLTSAAIADAPKESFSAASTRGAVISFQNPSKPSSHGRMISAASGMRTMALR